MVPRSSCNHDTEKEVGDQEGKDHRGERGHARWATVIGDCEAPRNDRRKRKRVQEKNELGVGRDLLAGLLRCGRPGNSLPVTGEKERDFAMDVKSLHTTVQTRPLTQKNPRDSILGAPRLG